MARGDTGQFEEREHLKAIAIVIGDAEQFNRE